MKRQLLIALTCVFVGVGALVIAPPSASAQFRVGPTVGYNIDNESGFIGADAFVGVYRLTDMIAIHANPGLSYYFIEDITLLAFDLDVAFLIEVSDMLIPYVAPGLGISYASFNDVSDTDLDFNLIGGAMFEISGIQPFAELRLRLGDGGSALEFAGGVLFGF